MGRTIYLSYPLSTETPLYGGRSRFIHRFVSSIKEGSTANNSVIETNVHVGTHIDLPFHFYEDGQTISAYPADFWFFRKPLVIELIPQGDVLKQEVEEKLDNLRGVNCDLLLIKTGFCYLRGNEKYWRENPGLSHKLYDYLIAEFPSIRAIGFDSISLGSLKERESGKIAHQKFLDPRRPILLIEDMDLSEVDEGTQFEEIIIAPLRIENCEGLPCTVLGNIH